MESDKLKVRHFLFFAFKKGETAAQACRNATALLRQPGVSERTCRRWFDKFRSGDFSLEDAPRTGRPTVIDDDVLKMKIRENPKVTTRELAAELGTSQGPIVNALGRLGIKKVAGALSVSVPEPLVPKKATLYQKPKAQESKRLKELVPSLSDTSDLDGDDELSQIFSEQQRLQQNHSRTRYCSKRKCDPRLPAGAAARLLKVPRQEQLDPSKSKIHSGGDKQSPIGSITVTGLTTGVGQRRSLRSRIGILNRRHKRQRQTPPIATSLENSSPSLLEQSIKTDIKEEVVDPEIYDQELGTIAPAQQMNDIVKENESLDVTLTQIKQEIKSEVLDEVDPDGLVPEQTTSIAANEPRNVEDVKLLGV